MGGVGSSADDALGESFNATVKREVLHDCSCWAGAPTCRREVFRGLVRYNTKRWHFFPATRSAASLMKATTHPLRCLKPPNHQSGVHYMGSRPPASGPLIVRRISTGTPTPTTMIHPRCPSTQPGTSSQPE